MSSILKALKKLENDKVSLRPSELKIDSEILLNANTSQFSIVKVLTTALLLVVAGSGATYMYMKQSTSPGAANVQLSRDQSPVFVEPVVKIEQLPNAKAVVSAQQKNKHNTETTTPHHPAKPVRTLLPVPVSKLSKPLEAQKPLVNAKSSLSTTSATSPTIVSTVPALRVNGIAFSADGIDSMAMINGVPVSKGAMIDGAKVEDILKNRVRFSYNGESFEIDQGQSNRQQ